MNWIDVEKELPEPDKMVIIMTREQPIVRFAICSWYPDQDCFIDYDDYPFTASHWAYIDPPVQEKQCFSKQKTERK